MTRSVTVRPKYEPDCSLPADDRVDQVRGVRQASVKLNGEIEQLAASIDRLLGSLKSIMLDECTFETKPDMDTPRPAACELTNDLENRCEFVIRLRMQVDDIVQRLDL